MKNKKEHGNFSATFAIFIVVGFLGFVFGTAFQIHHLGIILGLSTGFLTWYFKPLSDIVDKSSENSYVSKRYAPKNTIEPTSIVNISNTTIQAPKVKYNKRAPHCSKCKTNNIQILDNKRKAFSIGKAAAGGVLLGAVGATIGGFSGKKGKKYHAVCMNCGKKFTIKL